MYNASGDPSSFSPFDFGHCFKPRVFEAGPFVRDVIFLIIGIIGNFCLLTIIFKKMRTVPNYLIANLTVVDTGFLLLYLPYQVLSKLGEESKNFAFIRSDNGCKVYEYFRLVFMGVSITTLTALSIDRYLAVSKPLAFRNVRSGRQRLCAVLLGIGLIWIVAFIVSFPNLIMADYDEYSFTCTVSPWHDYFKAYAFSAAVVYLALPASIISFTYCCMARSLLKRNDLLESHGAAGNVSSRQRRQRVRLAVAVIIIVIVFVATWSLHYTTELIIHYNLHSTQDDSGCFRPHTYFEVLRTMAEILLRVNPVINPIILFSVSSSHRHYAKLTFCCCIPDKSKKHQFGKSISLTTHSTAESRSHKNSDYQKLSTREMQV